MVVLTTERLTLRPFVSSDAAHLAWIYTDPNVMRYIPPGTPWDHAKIDRFVAVCGERYISPGFGMWAVELRDGAPKVIGHCGLQHLAKTETIEIAWLLGAPYWNRGLASEAAKAVVAHGFTQLGFTRIVAVAEPPNGASLRIMQKLGMTLQGAARYYDRDLTMYALDAVEYTANQKAAAASEPNR
ncbi:MAG TPA: GNAT family N-acetyltransferase [Candidatus Eremiobacteraceae bacterium]|nr:GNAT family N-acetyltransferase [Candidatus Eremiobacteraceae bacterium]